MTDLPGRPREPLNGRRRGSARHRYRCPSTDPRTLRAPRAAPASHSPSRPTFASLPSAIGRSTRCGGTRPGRSARASSRGWARSARRPRAPRRGCRHRRRPGPRPERRSAPRSCPARRRAHPSASGPWPGPCTSCWSSTSPTSMLVPPTSTPATRRFRLGCHDSMLAGARRAPGAPAPVRRRRRPSPGVGAARGPSARRCVREELAPSAITASVGGYAGNAPSGSSPRRSAAERCVSAVRNSV